MNSCIPNIVMALTLVTFIIGSITIGLFLLSDEYLKKLGMQLMGLRIKLQGKAGFSEQKPQLVKLKAHQDN